MKTVPKMSLEPPLVCIAFVQALIQAATSADIQATLAQLRTALLALPVQAGRILAAFVRDAVGLVLLQAAETYSADRPEAVGYLPLLADCHTLHRCALPSRRVSKRVEAILSVISRIRCPEDYARQGESLMAEILSAPAEYAVAEHRLRAALEHITIPKLIPLALEVQGDPLVSLCYDLWIALRGGDLVTEPLSLYFLDYDEHIKAFQVTIDSPCWDTSTLGEFFGVVKALGLIAPELTCREATYLTDRLMALAEEVAMEDTDSELGQVYHRFQLLCKESLEEQNILGLWTRPEFRAWEKTVAAML